MREAILVLRDGRVFRGQALGAEGETAGEVIFNTAMSGYQEILTDPSYRGQIVTMTYPMIGNYGLNDEDVESRKPWVNGLIVKEASPYPSSWRGRVSLDDYLKAHGIVGLQGIDTRALTRHLRDHGSQDGIVSTVERDVERLRERARGLPQIVGRDLVKEVSVTQPFGWHEGEWKRAGGYVTPPPARFNVVAYDAGIKLNILRQLSTAGCDVTVVPADTPAAAGSRATSISTTTRARDCATGSCRCSACSTTPKPHRGRTTRITSSHGSPISWEADPCRST